MKLSETLPPNPLPATSQPQINPPVILIVYTTLYRTGGDKFLRAAKTMAKEKARQFPNFRVVCEAVESKSDFLYQIERINHLGDKIHELHFIGHSGVYGIMFGTTDWPEQFSPYEWKTMNIPKTPHAEFYFHACRTGRWFAPFISRTLGVKAHGYFWYTSISTQKEKLSWDYLAPQDQDLYIISCPGKKSHGLLSSIGKYMGIAKAFPLLSFDLKDQSVDTSYDHVAKNYDETFSDIKVRHDEWSWILSNRNAIDGKTVLDIGCGNAALLQELSQYVKAGIGVDLSHGMIEQAKKRNQARTNLKFSKIDGPSLPLEDNSVDTILSMLSFRYLDWDPMIHEMLRVLKPGGEILILDMVAAPVKIKELHFFIISKLKYLIQKFTHPEFHQTLQKMVNHPEWKKMLQYNPIRSEHEMKWYLESRFPGKKIQLINVGWNSRIISFRSGPVLTKKVEKISYP